MLKRFVLFLIVAVCTAVGARGDSISGFFSATGTDTFTSSTITFSSAQVAGALGGTFATYLTDGTAITFLPGPLPYSNGFNTPPNPPFTTGSAPLFTVTGGGTTFTFHLTDYTAGYITNGSNGCSSGSTCLDVTGDGFFTSTGVLTGTSGNATFSFTSQYVANQPQLLATTFSASTQAVPPAPIPEPAALALVGSGLIG